MKNTLLGAVTGTLDTVAVGWTTFVAMLLIICPGIPIDPEVTVKEHRTGPDSDFFKLQYFQKHLKRFEEYEQQYRIF